MEAFSLGMVWKPGVGHTLHWGVAVLSLRLTALDLGGSRNLVLRRLDVGGGRPAQGRRHDWVGA